MYLLYVDDSGSIDDPNTQFLVLAGISIFERQTHWLDKEINTIAARFNQQFPENVEFHASPMRAGSHGWENYSPADRVQATADILHLLTSPQLKVKVYAAVIEKALLPRGDIIPQAFEHLATVFDDFLAARYHKKKDPQRGIVIFDNAKFETHVQTLSHTFKHYGHANGHLRNFAEVPLFIDSRRSRLIQMADMIAYWIFRRYQSLDARGFDMIQPHIHGYNGQRQGLFESISQATVAVLANPPAQR